MNTTHAQVRATLITAARRGFIGELLRFVERSPSPAHCAASAARLLRRAGFLELDERSPFAVVPGGSYFVRRQGGLVAFRRGLKAPQETGFRIVAAHTDSPCLRLKPKLLRPVADHLLVDVDVYGKALLYTWLDRDLGIAGTVWVDDGHGVRRQLVRSSRALCRIPSLAVHLDPDVNERGLVLNPQQHLGPLLASHGIGMRAAVDALLAEHGLRRDQIRAHDLCLFDVQAPTLGGLDEEFVFGPRLDDQAMCFAGLAALVGAGATRTTNILALFDHEEVGSTTAGGGHGNWLLSLMRRLVPAAGHRQQALARSFVVSADMGHALHPGHVERHDPRYAPTLNGGLILKHSVNQRYASDGGAQATFRHICRRSGVPLQDFVNRSDLSCGSTVGPRLHATLGASAVDIGAPLLSMHSIRELAGVRDLVYAKTALRAAFTSALH